MDRRATFVDAPCTRRRRRAALLAGGGLLIAGCTGETAGAPVQGGASPDPTRGTIVPASTRDVGLPSLAADGQVAAAARPVTAAPPAPTAAAPSDPRTVPSGTPAHIARVFQRLPVAIHDGPPLGAIGESGIHVDKIWLGSAYEKDGCAGEASMFSLAAHEQVNVCFRVVHSREEESVEVEWVKDGAPFRRRAVNIPDLHAYRSRAYLVLRREYIGEWQARVLSADQVTLATIAFTVAP